MGFVIYMTFKMASKMFALMLLLCWAVIALPVALIASLTGHDRTARQWMRSMHWRRMF